jgi:hypothetical protein
MLSLLAVGLACGDEPPGFTVDYDGQRIQLDLNGAGFACQGNIRELEAQAEALEDLFGRPLTSKIRIVLTNSPPENCTGSGCYYRDDDTVRGIYTSLSHEIVHAYLAQAFPHTTLPAFLGEGVAVALQGGDVARYLSLADLLATDDTLSASDYLSAGHFVRWLIDEFGIDDVAALLDRIDGGDADDLVIAAMEQVFGASFEGLGQRYASESPRTYPGLGPAACGTNAGPNVWVGSSIGLQADLTCRTSFGKADAASPPSGELWAPLRLDLEGGTYSFAAHDAAFALIRCNTEPGEYPELPLDHPAWFLGSWSQPWPRIPGGSAVVSDPQTIALDAGLYVLWFGATVQNPAEALPVTLELIRH